MYMSLHNACACFAWVRALFGGLFLRKNPNPMVPTHMYLLLDRSGSMMRLADEVVTSLNAFVASQRQLPGEAWLTLVQFDSVNAHEVVLAEVQLDQVPTFRREEFVPRGSTPLFDATMGLVRLVEHQTEERAARGLPPANVLFITLTDGGENCSRHATHTDVAEAVAAGTAAGWTFMHLCTDPATARWARSTGIREVSTFANTPAGMKAAFDDLGRQVVFYRQKFDKVNLNTPSNPE